METSYKDYYVMDAMLYIDDKFLEVPTTFNFDIKSALHPRIQ